MSKGASGLFSGTKGSKAALISKLKSQNIKFSEKDVVFITRDKTGQIVWLEKGRLAKNPSGLAHIIDAHESDFNRKGIASSDIPDLIIAAVSKGEVVGYQGKGTGRPIYKVTYNGKEHKIAITIGSNGYIVGANPSK